MPIKGLTDQYKAQGPTALMGRQVRLGYIQKGERETDKSGKVIRMIDHEYFVFKPVVPQVDLALQAWTRAYGNEPKMIPDVRIPVSPAGNFNIEDQAWRIAARHGRSGSMFLARSDGERIYQARGEDGKVVVYQEADRPSYTAVTKLDNKDRECFPYQGKLYPWANSMMIDLVLPDLNRELLRGGFEGYGVVTFVTRAANDIPTIIANYMGILHDLASLYADPLDQLAMERQIRNIPLRDIPLALERYQGAITTPGWGDNPEDRQNSSRWLVRLSLNAQFAAAVEAARSQRTDHLMAMISGGTQLQLGGGRQLSLVPGSQVDQLSLEELNDQLFGEPAPARPQPRPQAQETEEDWAGVIEGYYDDPEVEETHQPSGEVPANGWELLPIGGGVTVPRGHITARCAKCDLILHAPRGTAIPEGGVMCPDHAQNSPETAVEEEEGEPFPIDPGDPVEAQEEPVEEPGEPVETAVVKPTKIRTEAELRALALAASSRADFCQWVLEWDHQRAAVFADVEEVERGYAAICGRFNHKHKPIAWDALLAYLKAVIDGSKRITARDAAVKLFKEARQATNQAEATEAASA